MKAANLDELTAGLTALRARVHAHPWRAIAATGILAFLLGLLVRRR